jgi:hypothetical protein
MCEGRPMQGCMVVLQCSQSGTSEVLPMCSLRLLRAVHQADDSVPHAHPYTCAQPGVLLHTEHLLCRLCSCATWMLTPCLWGMGLRTT